MELTLPGFVNDAFSSVYPLGIGSPFFRSLPLDQHGLAWVHPEAPLAHPFDDGTAAVLERSFEPMRETLGDADARAWRELMWPLVKHWHALVPDMLSPFGIPRHPFRMAAFGMEGLRSLKGLAEARFRGDRARALLGACSGHVGIPLDYAATGWFSSPPGMRWGGRWRWAARGRSPSRSPRCCARWAARSAPACASARWPTCRPRARCCWT